MNKGFTMIEMVIVILLIGILSIVAIPRFEKRIELEELKSEKKFTYQIWEELELHAKEQLELRNEYVNSVGGKASYNDFGRIEVYVNL